MRTRFAIKIIFLIICSVIISCEVCKNNLSGYEIEIVNSLQPVANEYLESKFIDCCPGIHIEELAACTQIYENSISFLFSLPYNRDSFSLKEISHNIERVRFYYYYYIPNTKIHTLLNIDIRVDSNLFYIDTLNTSGVLLDAIYLVEKKQLYNAISEIPKIAEKYHIDKYKLTLYEQDGIVYWNVMPSRKTDSQLLINIININDVIILPPNKDKTN